MTFLAATVYENWPIIKQLAWLLGYVMRGIFWVLSQIGIVNIGACIIVFTIITRMMMYPLTVKQQKLTKLNAIMMPEIQALQKKYAGKNRDQQAMMKMQAEQQMIYDKYGASMTAGCLPTLIQFPILFALYPVIYNITKYVPAMATYDAARLYNFFGINLQEAPGFRLSVAILIPILAGVTQFISTKLMMANQPNMNDSPMGGSMKMMNYMMPIMSVVFCISLPAFLGVYWIMQSLVMVIQQLIVNKHMSRYSVEDLIKQNIEKKNKKRAKKGLPPLNDKATINAKKIQQANAASAKANLNKDERDAKIKESTQYYQNKSGGGSLASKANRVREYNEKHKK